MENEQFKVYLNLFSEIQLLSKIVAERNDKLFLSDIHYEELQEAKSKLINLFRIVVEKFNLLSHLQHSLLELEFPILYKKISLGHKNFISTKSFLK